LPDLNPVDDSMCKILQKEGEQTRITDLELSAINDATDEWMPQ